MKKLTVLIAIAAVSLVSTSAFAGGWGKRDGRGVSNDELSRRSPQVRGYLFRPGGHRYDFEYESFLQWNGPYGNYPGFDARDFKERVYSDPRFNTTSPSAF